MRVLIMAKEGEQTQEATPPSPEAMAAYQKFNEELVKAGVVLEAGRLQPSSQGKRVRFDGNKRTVIDGPFTETKELIAGYWLIQVKSKEEAIEWVKRSPAPMGPGQDAEIEIRQVFEASDFPAEIFPPEAAAREQAMRDELQKAAKR